MLFKGRVDVFSKIRFWGGGHPREVGALLDVVGIFTLETIFRKTS